MAQKIGLKSVGKEDINKLLSLTDDEIANTSSDELVGMLALLDKRKADISDESDSLMESSGINALDDEASAIKTKMAIISRALALSNFFDDNEKVMINIHKDETVVSPDGTSSTDDVIDSMKIYEKKVKYIPKYTDTNFDDFLDKLIDLNLLGSIKIGTKRVAGLTGSELREVKNCLRTYGLLDIISVNNLAFDSEMQMYSTQRNSLIEAGFCDVDAKIAAVKQTTRQLSLFINEEELGLDVIPLDIEEAN